MAMPLPCCSLTCSRRLVGNVPAENNQGPQSPAVGVCPWRTLSDWTTMGWLAVPSAITAPDTTCSRTALPIETTTPGSMVRVAPPWM